MHVLLQISRFPPRANQHIALLFTHAVKVFMLIFIAVKNLIDFNVCEAGVYKKTKNTNAVFDNSLLLHLLNRETLYRCFCSI